MKSAHAIRFSRPNKLALESILWLNYDSVSSRLYDLLFRHPSIRAWSIQFSTVLMPHSSGALRLVLRRNPSVNRPGYDDVATDDHPL